MKSQQLWSLHRTKNSQHSSTGMGAAWAPSLAEELLTDSWWLLGEGGSVFFKAVAPGRSPRLKWMAPHPGIYEQYRFCISGLFKKKKSFLNEVERVGRWCWIWVALVGEEEWSDQNTMCVCRIVSENKCRVIKKLSLYHLGFSNEQILLYYLHDLYGQIQGRSVRCDINISAV